MKKHTIKHFISIISICAILVGCGQTWAPSYEDFTINNQTTNKGITVGSSFEDFASAYEQYPIESIDDDGNITPYSIPDLEADPDSSKADMSLMVSYFFIDSVPKSVPELITETGKDASHLSEYLSSEEYLKTHTVIFKYLIFDFSDGSVISISDDYLNYNQEL